MDIKKFFTFTPDTLTNFRIKEAYSDNNYIPQKNDGGDKLGFNYRQNLNVLSQELCKGKSGDLKTREFTVRIKDRDVNATIFYIDGLVNKQLINDFISQRTNHICTTVYKTNEYINLRNKYNKLREEIQVELANKKKNLLEDLEELHYSMQGLEFDMLYKYAFNDSIKITIEADKLFN